MLDGQIQALPGRVQQIASGPFGLAVHCQGDPAVQVMDPATGDVRFRLPVESLDFRFAAGGWRALVVEPSAELISCYDLRTGQALGGGFSPLSVPVTDVLMGSGSDAEALLIGEQDGRSIACLVALPDATPIVANILPRSLPDCSDWQWQVDAGLTRLVLTHPVHGQVRGYQWHESGVWQDWPGAKAWGQVGFQNGASLLPTAVAEWQLAVDADGELTWRQPKLQLPLGQLPQWPGLRPEGGAVRNPSSVPIALHALRQRLHMDVTSSMLQVLSDDRGFLVRRELPQAPVAVALPDRCRYRPGEAFRLALCASKGVRWQLLDGPSGMDVTDDQLIWHEPRPLGVQTVLLGAIRGQAQVQHRLQLLASTEQQVPVSALRHDGVGLTGLVLTSSLGGAIDADPVHLMVQLRPAEGGRGRLHLTRRPRGAIGVEAALEQAYRYQCLQLPAMQQMDTVLSLDDLFSVRDGHGLALTAAVAFRALCSDRPLAQDLAVIGRIEPDGSLVPVSEPGVQLATAREKGLLRVVMPAANRPDLADLALLGQLRLIQEVQVFLADSVDQALAFSLADRAAPVSRAYRAYRALLPRLLQNETDASLPDELQRVIEQCPGHATARYQLQRLRGQAPEHLSTERARILTGRELLPFDDSLNRNIPRRGELLTLHLKRMEEGLSRLYPLLDPETEAIAVASRDWLRQGAKCLQLQGQIAAAEKESDKARIRHQLEEQEVLLRDYRIKLEDSLAFSGVTMAQIMAGARR